MRCWLLHVADVGKGSVWTTPSAQPLSPVSAPVDQASLPHPPGSALEVRAVAVVAAVGGVDGFLGGGLVVRWKYVSGRVAVVVVVVTEAVVGSCSRCVI